MEVKQLNQYNEMKILRFEIQYKRPNDYEWKSEYTDGGKHTFKMKDLEQNI